MSWARRAWARFWLRASLLQLQAAKPALTSRDDFVFNTLLAARMAELTAELAMLKARR